MRTHPKAKTEGKGIEGENCNVTACQKPKSAFYYNTVMKAFYCDCCATEIERFARMDGHSFFDNLEENIRKNHKKEVEKLLSSCDD